MNWENNPFIENAKKSISHWEKGFDLSGADALTLEKFIAYASIILKPLPSIVRYDTSIIQKLIKKDVLFTEKHEILISDKPYQLGQLSTQELRSLLRNEKNVKVVPSINQDINIIKFLETISIDDFERELTFCITNRFDQMIIDKKLTDVIDLEFVNQIHSTTHLLVDQIKFVFFTMAQHEPLKNDPLFKVLYKYLSNLKLEELYFYLRQS